MSWTGRKGTCSQCLLRWHCHSGTMPRPPIWCTFHGGMWTHVMIAAALIVCRVLKGVLLQSLRWRFLRCNPSWIILICQGLSTLFFIFDFFLKTWPLIECFHWVWHNHVTYRLLVNFVLYSALYFLLFNLWLLCEGVWSIYLSISFSFATWKRTCSTVLSAFL